MIEKNEEANLEQDIVVKWTRSGTPVIQSHVWHKGTCFFVSTILMECSSPYGQGIFYYEHMATMLNESDQSSLGIMAHFSSNKRLEHHFSLCEQLSRTGKYDSAHKENEMDADNGRTRKGTVMTTYVNYMSECFLITTINLKGPPSNCSPQYFHKTTASTFDTEGKEIMDTIAVIEDGVAIDNHLAMCEQLSKTGKYISKPTEAQ